MAVFTSSPDKNLFLVVRIGTLEGAAVKIMYGNVSSGCVVRESLVDHSQHAENFANVRITDGSAITCPKVATIFLRSCVCRSDERTTV